MFSLVSVPPQRAPRSPQEPKTKMSPPVNILHTSATGNLGDHAKLGLANVSLLRYLAGRPFYGGKGGGKDR